MGGPPLNVPANSPSQAAAGPDASDHYSDRQARGRFMGPAERQAAIAKITKEIAALGAQVAETQAILAWDARISAGTAVGVDEVPIGGEGVMAGEAAVGVVEGWKLKTELDKLAKLYALLKALQAVNVQVQTQTKKKKKGDPVSIATGSFIEDWIDFELPGTLAVVGTRHYDNQLSFSGPLGRNRISTLDVVIEVMPQSELRFLNEDGLAIWFDQPAGFKASQNGKHKHLSLSSPRPRQLVLEDGQISRYFKLCASGKYRLDAIDDRNRNSLKIERDERERIVRATHSDGYELTFLNDDQDLRTQIDLLTKDGTSLRLADYGYDSHGNLEKVRCGTHWSFRYEYDEKHRLSFWTDDIGRSFGRLIYDDQDRVVRTETNGPWDQDVFEYDTPGRETTFRPGGKLGFERFIYDNDNNILSQQNSLGDVRRYTYQDCQQTSETDELGHTKSTTYDVFGNVQQHRDEEGRQTTYRWSGPGQLGLMIDGEGGIWRYEYDQRGNLVESLDPRGAATRFEWDGSGRLLKRIFADGATEARDYDERHRLVAVHAANGRLTRYSYDAFDRIVSIGSAVEGETKFEYADHAVGPAFRRPVRVIRPDGVKEERTFDAGGQLVAIRDGKGRTASYRSGSFDLLSEIVDAKGGVVSISYDVRGLISRVRNPKGQEFIYERDETGAVVAETDFDGRCVRYERDAAGRVIKQINADGGVIVVTRDRSGLIIERRSFAPGVDPSTAEPEEHEHFRYDGRGLMVHAKNLATVVAFERDACGRVVSETVNGRTVQSKYDPRGRRIERRLFDNTVTYGHDLAGALTELNLNGRDGTHLIAMRRDDLGRETARIAGAFRLDQTFSRTGHLLRQTTGLSLDGQRGLDRLYTWTEALEPAAIVDDLWGRTAYEYDRNGQIVEARHREGLPLATPDAENGILGFLGDQVEIERFAYDAGHDIAASDTAQPGDPLGRPLTPWLASAGGRISAARGAMGERILLTYDARGRVVGRRVEQSGFRPQIWTYAWNGLDRLISCILPNGEVWRYSYDPFGRRLSKRTNGGHGRAFSWDGDVVAEDAPIHADGSVRWDVSISWHFQPGSSQPLLRQEGRNVLHVVADHLGTPRDLYNERGERVWSRAARVWGATQETRKQGSDNDNFCPLRFPGQWEDAESGLCYNRFRYYDPTIGVYVSPDPIGMSGGLRLNGYVDCPAVGTDFFGLVSPRDLPGVASGSGSPVGNPWLGPNGAGGPTPTQVAGQLNGQEFNNFGEYRKAYWKAVSRTPELNKQFSPANQALMAQGNAPFAPTSQQNDSGAFGMTYNLDHINPIASGGGVYDADNIQVVSPLSHYGIHYGP